MKDMGVALWASAVLDDEEDNPKGGKKDSKKKKKKPAEKGTQEAASATYIKLFGEKWFSCIDC